jgi:phosphohistidine phosphatase
MRHGIAEKRVLPDSGDDAARPLTDKGRRRVKQIASGLKRLGCTVDWIVTSPLLRAWETADIAAAELNPKGPLDVCKALSPGGSSDEVVAFISAQPSRNAILVVGHEPDLSELAAHLLGAGKQAGLSFKKGGCCLIECDRPVSPSRGRLVWWLTPKVLR